MNKEPLYSMLYSSREQHEFSQSEIDQLLAYSRAHNSKHDITGMLVYSAGSFMQALEGPKDQVEKLFEKIAADKRHGSIKVLGQYPVESRLFKEWTMAYQRVDDHKALPEGFSEFLSKGFTGELTTEDPELVPTMLLAFRSTFMNEWLMDNSGSDQNTA